MTSKEIGHEAGVINWPEGESINGPASPSRTNELIKIQIQEVIM